MTEQEMRAMDVPRIETWDELRAFVDRLEKDDYGKVCYAISMACVALFNLLAHTEGITGFQASCADLDFIRRTRQMTGPFMILNGNDMLYPQLGLQRKVDEFVANNEQWAADEATKQLAAHASPSSMVHPDVWAHWEALAAKRQPYVEVAYGEVEREL